MFFFVFDGQFVLERRVINALDLDITKCDAFVLIDLCTLLIRPRQVLTEF